jgi:hypothetical protein
VQEEVCRRRCAGGGVQEEVCRRRCAGGGVQEEVCRRCVCTGRVALPCPPGRPPIAQLSKPILGFVFHKLRKRLSACCRSHHSWTMRVPNVSKLNSISAPHFIDPLAAAAAGREARAQRPLVVRQRRRPPLPHFSPTASGVAATRHIAHTRFASANMSPSAWQLTAALCMLRSPAVKFKQLKSSCSFPIYQLRKCDGRRRFQAKPPPFPPRALWQNPHLHRGLQALPSRRQGARARGNDRPKVTRHVNASSPPPPTAPYSPPPPFSPFRHAPAGTKPGSTGTPRAPSTRSPPRSSPT